MRIYLCFVRKIHHDIISVYIFILLQIPLWGGPSPWRLHAAFHLAQCTSVTDGECGALDMSSCPSSLSGVGVGESRVSTQPSTLHSVHQLLMVSVGLQTCLHVHHHHLGWGWGWGRGEGGVGCPCSLPLCTVYISYWWFTLSSVGLQACLLVHLWGIITH